MIRLLDAGDPALLDRLRETREAGDVPLVGDPRWPAAQWDAVRAAAATARVPDGVAWASLTSGSSGTPRIVLRSEESWAASYPAVAELLGDGPVLLPAPASSSLTLFSLAQALATGLRPVLGSASPAAACLHGTPQALRAVLDAGAAPRLSAALVGGSRLDPALRARAEAAGVRVAAYYGAAELSFVAVDPDGDGLRAFPGVELAVRDGVLWVRSPFVAAGYAGVEGEGRAGRDGRPAGDGRATRDGRTAGAGRTADDGRATDTPLPSPLRRDGDWATVGDRAELSGGRLRLLGRADDAILSASATIVPEEVEAVLRAVPGVRDAVVFGVPREPVGALVAALVEADGVPLAALRRAAEERLAPAHRPRRWFTGALPRTASGKPARAEVVRRVLAGEVTRLAE